MNGDSHGEGTNPGSTDLGTIQLCNVQAQDAELATSGSPAVAARDIQNETSSAVKGPFDGDEESEDAAACAEVISNIVEQLGQQQEADGSGDAVTSSAPFDGGGALNDVSLEDDVDLGMDFLDAPDVDLDAGGEEEANNEGNAPDAMANGEEEKMDVEPPTRDIPSPHDIEINYEGAEVVGEDRQPLSPATPPSSSPVPPPPVSSSSSSSNTTTPLKQPPEQQQEQLPQSAATEESSAKPAPVVLPSLFGSRAMVLKLERLRLPKDCIVTSDGRTVDARVLRKARPDLFVKKAGSSSEASSRPKKSKDSSGGARKDSGKSKQKKETAEKKPRKPHEKASTSSTSSAVKKTAAFLSSSDDSSDSDMEELKKRMFGTSGSGLSSAKPTSSSTSGTAATTSSAVIDAKEDLVKKEKERLLAAKAKAKAERANKPKVQQSTSSNYIKPSLSSTSSATLKPPPMLPTSGPLIKPCYVKLQRLPEQAVQIALAQYRRSQESRRKSIVVEISSSDSSRASSRSRSRHNSEHRPSGSTHKTSRVAIISSSDSEDEFSRPKQQETAAKKMVKNPLFGNNEEVVKLALVEKLYDLLKSDESKAKAEASKDSEKPKKDVKDVSSKSESTSDHAKKSDVRVEKEIYKAPKVEFADARESIETKMLTTHRELRPFVDLLKSEVGGGSLNFLGSRVILRDLEVIVHKAIAKLNTTKPTERPDRSKLPKPTSYQQTKYKLKDCSVKLRDAKSKKQYAEALKAFEKDGPSRMRRRRDTLLSGLRLVAVRRKDPFPSKRRFYSSSDDSDDDLPSSKKAKVKYEDLNTFGSFK